MMSSKVAGAVNCLSSGISPLIVDQCVKHLALAFGKSIRIDLMVDERVRPGVGAAGSLAAAAAP
jgi:hypothetical protein